MAAAARMLQPAWAGMGSVHSGVIWQVFTLRLHNLMRGGVVLAAYSPFSRGDQACGSFVVVRGGKIMAQLRGQIVVR